MKHAVLHITMGSLIFMTALIFSCSDSEPRTGLLGQTSTVIINLGLPDDLAMVNPSIIDRIRRFFARDAIAQTAPATFSSVKVRIIAEDIGVIEKTFNPYGVISLNVPAGNLRFFEVTAYVSPTDPSAAASFKGTALANLEAGKTVNVPVSMSLNETKIVVPDHSGSRIVMIDDITGKNWKEYTYTGVTTFLPSDVTFDGQGKIYICNEYDTNADVVRIDDIRGTNQQAFNPISSSSGYGNIRRMAIDKQRNMIYYITSTELLEASLSNIATISQLDTSNSIWSSLKGIDIAPDGTLYIVNGYTSNWCITKYNPANTVTYVYQTVMADLNQPEDIYVQYPYLYIANYGSSTDGYQILQYQIDGTSPTLVGHFGNKTIKTAGGSVNNTYPMFYGAQNILAIRNDLFVIIDFGELDTVTGMPRYYDWSKLILTSTTLGSGWQTYGSFGTGPGYFKFYSTC